MKKNLNIKIFTIILVIPAFILILDLMNISKIIPFTFNFDWLAFVGGYLSFVATLILANVSIKQNNRLNDINKKIVENNTITTCYSKIDMDDNHYFQFKKKYLTKDYGNILKNIDYELTESKDKYFRFIFEVKDLEGRPLKSAKVTKAIFQIDPDMKDGNYIWKKELKYENVDLLNVILEKNDEKNDTYFLPIILIDSESNINNILKSLKIRITINVETKNIFKVVNVSEHTIIVTPTTRGTNLGLLYKKELKKAYYIDAFIEDDK